MTDWFYVGLAVWSLTCLGAALVVIFIDPLGRR